MSIEVVRAPTAEEQLAKQCQDDVTALVQAWADRGVSPFESAQVLASIGHAMLRLFNYSLADLQAKLAERWTAEGGRP